MMTYSCTAHNFTQWREKSRTLLLAEVPPEQVEWNAASKQASLFSDTPLPPVTGSISIQKSFFPMAQNVAYHRAPEKWWLLYQAAWRMTHGEPHLLELQTDVLVRQLMQMEKAVSRDAHKAKAFVRFRKMNMDGAPFFVAWHEPDHFILQKVGGFFARRFADMRWSILTPDECAHWDGEKLTYTDGADISEKPPEDAQEDLWREYYRATFNPARIKINMMKSEMPVRYWKNLPETRIIADMLREAPARVQTMLRYTQAMPESATPFVPAERSLRSLKAAAAGCQGCRLHQTACHTVFGSGSSSARLMFVCDTPDSDEDTHGYILAGEKGEQFQSLLAQTGIQPDETYITYAVKHASYRKTRSGEKILRPPTQMEINACLPWLQAEIEAVNPAAILGFGAIAGKALLGPSFMMSRHGRQWLQAEKRKLWIAPSFPLPEQKDNWHALCKAIKDATLTGKSSKSHF